MLVKGEKTPIYTRRVFMAVSEIENLAREVGWLRKLGCVSTGVECCAI